MRNMKFIRRFFEGRKINLWQDIAACGVMHILLIASILTGLLPALRILRSLLCLLVTPGYATLAAFFPAGKDIDHTTRFGLSPIVSIAVLIPIGLVLNYSIWGLRLEAILTVSTVYVVLFGLAALWRRPACPRNSSSNCPGRAHRGRGKDPSDGCIVSAFGIAVWGYFEGLVAEKRENNTPNSTFWARTASPINILSRLPWESRLTVILGIANHENVAVLYHVVIMEADGTLQRIASITLEDNQTWEQPCTFTLTIPGERNRTSFLLYREGDSEPYRSLQLWITVLETPQSTPRQVKLPY